MSQLNQIMAKVLTKASSMSDYIEANNKNIYIIGDIDEQTNEKVISKLLEDDIDKNSVINIFISSGGGNLYDCLAMIDLIEYQKEHIGYTVNTYGLGEVCSGGFFMLLLGDNRMLFPKCRVYVHEHIVLGEEEAPFSKKIKSLKEEYILNKIYVQFVADCLDISFDNAKKLLKKDKWLSNKEIDEFNIVTEGDHEHKR